MARRSTEIGERGFMPKTARKAEHNQGTEANAAVSAADMPLYDAH